MRERGREREGGTEKRREEKRERSRVREREREREGRKGREIKVDGSVVCCVATVIETARDQEKRKHLIHQKSAQREKTTTILQAKAQEDCKTKANPIGHCSVPKQPKQNS